MADLSFQAFLKLFPIYKALVANPQAIHIFEKIVLREDVLVRIHDANLAGKAGLSVCAREIEDYIAAQTGTTFFFDDAIDRKEAHKNKQAVGCFVKFALIQFGVNPAVQGKLKPLYGFRWFKNASVYVIDPSITPTLRVVRRIEEANPGDDKDE